MRTRIYDEFDFFAPDMDLCGLTKEIWCRFFTGEVEEVEELTELLAEDCVIVGTGKSEFYENRNTFLPIVAKAIQQKTHMNFTVSHFWGKEKVITEHTRLVYGDVAMVGNIDERRSKFQVGIHYTILYQYREGRWKIIYINQSIPNHLQKGGKYFLQSLVGQIQEIWQYADEMSELAQKDALTGLMNRTALDTRVKTFQKEKGTAIAFYFDLDNFKAVNDTFGHAAGDLVLKKTGEILQNIFRKGDSLARIGGDEFCVLLEIEVPNRDAALQVIQKKIRRLLNCMPIIVQKGKKQIFVTFSVGVCAYMDKHDITFKEILESADDAMYEIKKAGKNGACIYLENSSVRKITGTSMQQSGTRIVICEDTSCGEAE